jgi:AbrB family looped-hinge helix DNA binding protein
MAEKEMKTIIRVGGRIVIPVAYRKALGIKPGDEVQLVLEDGEIRMVSQRQAIVRAQNLLRRYVPRDRNLSEELIKERREEASRG